MEATTRDLMVTLGSGILEVPDLGGLTAAAEWAFQAIGFTSFLVADDADTPAAAIVSTGVRKWPDGALETYIEEGHADRDQILALLDRAEPTSAWVAESNATDDEARRFYAFCTDFGAKSGIIAKVLHQPGRVRFASAVTDTTETFSADQHLLVLYLGNLICLQRDRLVLGSAEGAIEVGRVDFEVLRWMAEGKSNSIVAELLNMKERTVAARVSRLLLRVGVSTRTQAVGLYYAGLVFAGTYL